MLPFIRVHRHLSLYLYGFDLNKGFIRVVLQYKYFYPNTCNIGVVFCQIQAFQIISKLAILSIIRRV